MRVSEHEDYMHFNTLSMVGPDGREGRGGRSRSSSTTVGMRRNQSWIATLKDFAVGDRSRAECSPVAEGSSSPRRLKLRRSTPSLRGWKSGVVSGTQKRLVLAPLEPETKPDRAVRPLARSKTVPGSQSNITTTCHGGNLLVKPEGTEGVDVENTTIPHIRFSDTKNLFAGMEEDSEGSIGRGRLTMTSRTGYFQDRIIPPSMVGAVSGFLFFGKFSGSLTIRWARCGQWPSCISQTGTRISALITRCHQS